MSKQDSELVWFLTHDNSIDHRILSFVNVIKKNGKEVFVFAGYKPIPDLMEESFIVRPYSKVSVYISDVLDDSIEMTINEENEIREVIELFESTKKETHRINYNSRQFLCAKTTIGFSEFIMVDIGKCYYVMHGFKKKLSKIKMNKTTPLRQAAVMKLTEMSTDNYIKNNNVDEFLSLNELRLSVKDNYSCVYENTWPATYILCDHEEYKLTEHIPNPCYYSENSIELGEEWDAYVDFIGCIYDFTPILKTVLEKVQECKIPGTVYVSDLPCLPIAIYMKEKFSCKIIMDCHEWWKGQSVLWEPNLKKKIDMIDLYEKKLYKDCDKIITVSSSLADLLTKYFDINFGYIRTNAEYLLSLGQSEIDDDFWEKTLDLPRDANVCIFQGSFTSLRNIENLVKAAKYLGENDYLVMVGGGVIESELKKIAKKIGAEQKIKFVGWVDQELLMKYTLNAKIGIIPYVAVNDYYATSFPNKMAEYYAAFLPVVVDNSMVEIKNIIEQDETGISVNCSDPKSLGEAIHKLLNNSDELTHMKKKIKVSRIFDKNAYEKDVLNLFIGKKDG